MGLPCVSTAMWTVKKKQGGDSSSVLLQGCECHGVLWDNVQTQAPNCQHHY
jgi:hypothetical protein